MIAANPLLAPWDGPFGLPDFAAVEDAHFRPAFDAAIAEQEAEFEAIASNPAPPDFENTIEALERHGRLLGRVSAIFRSRADAAADPAIQEIERDVFPRLARIFSRQRTDPRMFRRIRAVARTADGLDAERARVLDLTLKAHVRAGAGLSRADRDRMHEIMGRLSELGAAFSQTVLNDETDWSMTLGSDALDGLPDVLVDALRAEAGRRGVEGFAVTLARSSIEPFLAHSARRDLRERAFRAWVGRGEAANWPRIAEIVALRHERARLLGFSSFAAFKLDAEMAQTPERVRDLLMAVWKPAKARAAGEAADLEASAAGEGANIRIEPWDWRHHAEKVRRARHDLDEADIKPYLRLESVVDAAFDVASRLFGLSFEAVEVPLPHSDARAWEVRRDGAHVGLFIADYFARPSKRSGAWMGQLRAQQKLWSPGTPIVTNVCNFARSDPCLLGWDDAATVFHEFGHALHGLLSDVTHPMVSGTSVARDWVELPSQLYEHWLSTPDVLARHARHHETGAPMPTELVDGILAAETINQGFRTVEYLASALVDLEMHVLETVDDFDPKAFEAETLARLGMPAGIIMRHRSPHFEHVFSSDAYSAAYYSYIWSAVMDADAFRAFEEKGDVFDSEIAEKLLVHVYAAGGREKPEDAYAAFRGRLPGVEALLENRGLAPGAG